MIFYFETKFNVSRLFQKYFPRGGMEAGNSDGQTTENEFYKAKYRQLKISLKRSVEKNEYLKSELKINQKKLQILEEDKYFLIERLLTYEKPPESPEPPSREMSDSDQESSQNLQNQVSNK